MLKSFCCSNEETFGQRSVARAGDRPQRRGALSLIHFRRDQTKANIGGPCALLVSHDSRAERFFLVIA